MRVLRCGNSGRDITLCRVDFRKQTDRCATRKLSFEHGFERLTVQLRIGIGAVVADEAAAEAVRRNRAEAVADRQVVERCVLQERDNIRADRAADEEAAGNRRRTDGQSIIAFKQRLVGVEADQTANAVTRCRHAAADQLVAGCIQRAFIKTDHAADKVSTDNDRRYASCGELSVDVAERDCTAVDTGNAACKVADGVPRGHKVVNLVVRVRNIACAVGDFRALRVFTDNTADILAVAGHNAGIDAAFDDRACTVRADDAADIGVADDVACVGRDVGGREIAAGRARQTADDAADVIAAQHIAARAGREVLEPSLLGVADDAADIPADQVFLPVGARAFKGQPAASCAARAVLEHDVFSVADNAADAVSLTELHSETGIVRGIAGRNDQTEVIAVCERRGVGIRRRIACDAADRAVARDGRTVFRVGERCTLSNIRIACDTADAAADRTGRKNAGYASVGKETGRLVAARNFQYADDTADAMRLVCGIGERSANTATFGNRNAFQHAVAQSADRTGAEIASVFDRKLRVCHAQTGNRAVVLREQTEIFRLPVRRLRRRGSVVELHAFNRVAAGQQSHCPAE